MTDLHANTNLFPCLYDDFSDEEYLSHELELIYDSILDIYALSKFDGVRLDTFSNILSMILEKMANAFGQIESNLSLYKFVEEIRQAESEHERSQILKNYESRPKRAPRRVYE